LGQKDLCQSDFFENKYRFSDLFNGALFHGEQIIKPEELEEADSTLVIPREGGGSKTICDKIRIWRGMCMALLVLENQTKESDFSVFRTENRALFEILSRAGEKEKMDEIFREHPEWYNSLDEDSARAIAGVAGIPIDLEKIRQEDKKGEVYNMCKALEDLKVECRLEGRLEGKLEGKLETCLENLKSIMEKLQLPAEQAMEALSIPGEEREMYRKLL